MEGAIERYGVREQTRCDTLVDRAVELIRLVGYAIVDANYTADQLGQLSDAFERALAEVQLQHGADFLSKIDEHNTIRAPLAIDRAFLDLAVNQTVLDICRRLMGEYIILNQQNGIINPPHAQRYNQGAYHRDLPFQHFVASRPLAMNALFCVDDFTVDNGATNVIPASHKQEMFPDDATVAALQTRVCAPAGSYIVLDALLYHSGGVNRSDRPRRAVNHLYSVPIIRPQLDLPAVLGSEYTIDPQLRRLLGYELRVPDSLDAYYNKKRKQIGV